MRFKKLSMLLLMALFLCSIIIPFATAAVPGPVETFEKVGEWILKIFGFSWITEKGEEVVGAFMRICVFILVYLLLYLVSAAIPLFTGHTRARVMIAIILALISTIFIPAGVLIAIGEVYSTVAAVLMFTVVLGGIGFLYYTTWPLPGRFWVVIRLLFLILLWMLLSIVTTAVGGGL